MTKTKIQSGYESIVTNLVGMVRNETLEGRDFLAVPMVMIVEGVLNGSSGALYYPAEELAKVPQVWNHKPVVVYHPEMNGKALSACDADVIESHKIGIIMNTTWDGKRLKAEAWLEPSRIEKVDNRIKQALESGMMMEVSTGLFTENEETPGEYRGIHYDAIARNYRPDHLAILPDQIGACSIAAGAGLLRLNAENRGDILHILDSLGINADIAHDEIRMKLYDATVELQNDSMDFWIEDVFDEYFVYNKGGKLFKQAYSINDGKASLDGLPVEVTRMVTYETNTGGPDMDKSKTVDRLIANGKWEEDDRKFLLSLNEKQLEKMEANEGTQDGDTKPDDGDAKSKAKPEPEPVGNDDSKPEAKPEPVGNALKPATPEEYLANAPSEIRDVLSDALQTNAQKRAELIAIITTNERNQFTKEQLASLRTNDLAAIASLAKAEEEKPSTPALNYLGLASAGIAGKTEEEPLVMPTMNFAKSEK